MHALLADVADAVCLDYPAKDASGTLIQSYSASLDKPAQTAARDNWQQRQELAKGGERMHIAANESARIPASQPSSEPGLHSVRTSIISNTSALEYLQFAREREILSPFPIPDGFFLSRCRVFEPETPK
jgi:hypothetical protein